MHPAWLRCESLKYLDIHALSRLARQAPQHLKMQIYFCANPKQAIASPAVISLHFMDTDIGRTPNGM
jgi:hypothetical protein